jgi:hypothetical protein
MEKVKWVQSSWNYLKAAASKKNPFSATAFQNRPIGRYFFKPWIPAPAYNLPGQAPAGMTTQLKVVP